MVWEWKAGMAHLITVGTGWCWGAALVYDVRDLRVVAALNWLT